MGFSDVGHQGQGQGAPPPVQWRVRLLGATDHTDVSCEYSWYYGTDAPERY